MEDCLIVSVDITQKDRNLLLVARKSNDSKLEIVNQIWDDEAIEIYEKLTKPPTPIREKYDNIVGLYNKLIGNKAKYKNNKKKRKYYRKCGVCGERYEQSEMIRTNNSSNGWLCFNCHNAEHPEYDD